MHNESGDEEGAEETIEDLEAPAVSDFIVCNLPTTKRCKPPTCVTSTYCKPGTGIDCSKPTCSATIAWLR
jgi:hypothetical protein